MGQESACPEPSYWKVNRIAVDGERIVLHLIPVRTWISCPLCGVPSRRVHSRYRRRALDLPWFSWPVQLIIQARRFFCDSPECDRRIFVEPFPKALGRHARQTQRTRDSLLELAHCSTAQLAARVAQLLGFVTSPDSLLRLQRREQFPRFSPRILGVDEFALRKGRTYGTLVLDLERRIPVTSSRASPPRTSPPGCRTIPRWKRCPGTGLGLTGWLAKQPYRKPGKWRAGFTWSTMSAAL